MTTADAVTRRVPLPFDAAVRHLPGLEPDGWGARTTTRVGRTKAVLVLDPWCPTAVELRLLPASRHLHRWGVRRRRRWFRAAHHRADELVRTIIERETMAARIGTITIDTNDLDRAAAFWQAVTGYDLTSNDGGFATLAPADGTGPGLALQVVPEARPKGKNRLHLDLLADDLDEEVRRIQGLGATEVRKVEDGDYRWTVLRDTDGNEFCVVAA